MLLRNLLASLALAGLPYACSSPTPSTSSSSHWVTCRVIDDCRELAAAAACKAGYCVDSAGNRLSASDSGAGGTPGGDGGVTPRPCDPLARRDVPTSLGSIYGIGTAPDGTTYLADSVTTPTATDRVFVSDGNVLVRRVVAGSGSRGVTGGMDYTFGFDDGSGTTNLLVSVRGGKATAMGLGSNPRAFIGDPGAVDTVLTVKDPSFASMFTLQNLPGDVTIEYVADVDDGTVLVVTHPKYDWGYSDFRLFWGPSGDVVERAVDNVTRTRSGGTTIVFHDMSGASFTADFSWVLARAADGGTISHPGPGTLAGPGTQAGFVQRFPTPDTLDGLSFTCL